MWEKRTELNHIKKLWFALNFEVKFMLKSAFKIQWGWCKWMSSLLMQMESSLYRVWANAWVEVCVSLELGGVPAAALHCPATCHNWVGQQDCRCMSSGGLCWSPVLLLFPFCVTWPALSPSPASALKLPLSAPWAHPPHCGQSRVPHKDRLESKAFGRYQVLWVKVLLLSSALMSVS